MKTAFDPRHQKRKAAVQNLFAFGFNKEQFQDELTKKVSRNLKKIDNLVVQAAPAWPLDQINRIDLAVLRLAIYELVIVGKEPEKVIIDEAVELAKEFGGESSPSFVNGVLGHILKQKETKDPLVGGQEEKPNEA
ncbi:MAG: transcription antitermination factor NusB [bacterium]|nr:transcription antitermination factor NusB [bacterium]